MKNILFVCTGNTCRSPMAMAIFNDMAKKEGLEWQSDSAGLFADGVSKISIGAFTALANNGILCDYTSKKLDNSLMEKADMVFGITENHASSIISLFPQYSDKVFAFPTDISDPYGQSVSVYESCLSEIEDGIKIIVKHLKGKENG